MPDVFGAFIAEGSPGRIASRFYAPMPDEWGWKSGDKFDDYMASLGWTRYHGSTYTKTVDGKELYLWMADMRGKFYLPWSQLP